MLEEKLRQDKKKLISFYKRSDLLPKRVVKAFRKVKREHFVLEKYKEHTYINSPLPLLEGATISSPTMSLLLCKYAKLKKNDKVLEVGTGSGYQTALIAQIVLGNTKGKKKDKIKKVYSIEISKKLHKYAEERLQETDYYDQIVLAQGDGTKGWPNGETFQKIIVTATGREIPPPLIKQLEKKGTLVMPKKENDDEWLIRGIKKASGLDIEYLDRVRFVSLKGKYGRNNRRAS